MSYKDLHWVNTHKGAKDVNHILLHDEFLKAMYQHSLRPNESKVILFLLRWTWGEGKRSCEVTKELKLKALSSLVKRRIITKLDSRRYEIQADTSLWDTV